jgi:catalase
MVPVTPIGRMVLNRNPDNFFAETEQVAFCAAHIIPGLDFTNDPLLAGRIHSYVDTQLSRLGGPNFHEIPINASVAQVHNNQRDGLHRQAVHRGRVAYEPNSLGGGCPFQAGKMGFMSFPENVEEQKLRAKPELFAEHYAQARLFFDSQSAVEQAHIVGAFRFELSKVGVPAIRERMLASLRNASEPLAAQVAEGLGMALPEAMPTVLRKQPKYPLKASAALSMFARPGETGVASLKVALVVAPGMVVDSLVAVHDALAAAGAVPRYVGVRIGPVTGEDGTALDADASMENEPSFLFDALVLPDGKKAADLLARNGQTSEYIQNQYRHCKPILALGASTALLDGAGAFATLPDGSEDPGIVIADEAADGIERFLGALARRRHFERETDPPKV